MHVGPQVLEYMKEYVHRFNLEKAISFGRTVTITTPVMALISGESKGEGNGGGGAHQQCAGWEVVHESNDWFPRSLGGLSK